MGKGFPFIYRLLIPRVHRFSWVWGINQLLGEAINIEHVLRQVALKLGCELLCNAVVLVRSTHDICNTMGEADTQCWI